MRMLELTCTDNPLPKQETQTLSEQPLLIGFGIWCTLHNLLVLQVHDVLYFFRVSFILFRFHKNWTILL